MRLSMHRCVLSLGLIGLTVASARATTILDFEGTGNDGGENLSNTNTTTGTFGATTGTKALNVVAGANDTLFDIGTVNAQSTGSSLAHFNNINAGAAATGAGAVISFDISINTANVTTDGYYQLILIGGGDNGYFQDGYGNLINGYNIKGQGLSLGSLAASQGATLTATTPYANGIGSYHYSIPLFTKAQYTSDGGQHDPTYAAPGGYVQFSLSGSGGYAGTVLFGIDNVQVGVPVTTPEPATLGLLGIAGTVMLGRRRKNALTGK